jgi:hypothetical protein
MAAFGGDDVDTLALIFDKLQYIFRGYDSYIQTFTEMHTLYKQKKLSEREYYHGMTDAILKYSALEFLGLKALFEIKKSINRMNNPSSRPLSTQVLSENGTPASHYGTPNSLSSFISEKSLPSRDEVMQKLSGNKKVCTFCGKIISLGTKYCTTCGKKI